MFNYKRLILLAFAGAAALLSFGQDSTRLALFDELEPAVTVYQSEEINGLITSQVFGTEREAETVRDGYRVQVYGSNAGRKANTEAHRIGHELEDLDLGVTVYVKWDAPFWRVRVGDFRTQEEAEQFKLELIEILPEYKGSIYVVHDRDVTILKQ